MPPPSPPEWSVDRAFALFEARTNLERIKPELRNYRLDRMREIMNRLGGVPTAPPVVHIAGSKGKGSTAAYLAGFLAAGGARVGVYSSPHITGYRERFTVLRPHGVVGDPVDAIEEPLAVESRRVWTIVEEFRRAGTEEEDLPTTFELLTALAFRVFSAARCDWVVLETGLGGRLDATNVCSPRLSLITPIELEHTEYLGDTLDSIAREKAGIIKPDTPVLSAPQHPEAEAVLRSVAEDRRSSVQIVPPTPPPSPPAMVGTVQHTNIALALAAVDLLDLRPSPEEVARVVATTRLPGRGERIGRVLLDGAHTPESLDRLLREPENEGATVIFGATRGKPLAKLASTFSRHFTQAIVCRAGTFKPEAPERVAAALESAGIEVILEEEPEAALDRAREITAEDRRILVTGSLHLVAAVRPLVIQSEL